MSNSISSFLPSVILQFQYYKSLGDKTLERLSEDQLLWQPGEESTSIATIVKHLSGNMRSRWTDFLVTDGEKDFRDRDEEFNPDSAEKAVVLLRWQTGWKILFEALESLSEKDLESNVYIRGKGHSVVEAINRQQCHYAYHVGQIVWLGRMLLGSNWESLSIPKGQSQSYNATSFSKGNRKEHFTTAFLVKIQDDSQDKKSSDG